MTDPGVSHAGRVIQVNPTAEPHEEHGNMVRIRVQPDGELGQPATRHNRDGECPLRPRSLAVGQAARGVGMGRSRVVWLVINRVHRAERNARELIREPIPTCMPCIRIGAGTLQKRRNP